MNMKIVKGNNLPHELLLTTRQKRIVKHASENNFSSNIKLSRA